MIVRSSRTRGTSDRSGTYSMRRSRSSSWSLSEMPRTGPFWMRFMRCVVNPAILFRSRFDWISATSSAIFLLTSGACLTGGKNRNEYVFFKRLQSGCITANHVTPVCRCGCLWETSRRCGGAGGGGNTAGSRGGRIGTAYINFCTILCSKSGAPCPAADYYLHELLA